MSDVMTGVPVTMSTGTSTGLAALVVLRPRTAGEATGAMAPAASEHGLRDDRLRRREVLLHHLELQRRRRARRSA